MLLRKELLFDRDAGQHPGQYLLRRLHGVRDHVHYYHRRDRSLDRHEYDDVGADRRIPLYERGQYLARAGNRRSAGHDRRLDQQEKEYMGYLSIWNRKTEVHFFGVINRNYEKDLEEKLLWLEKNRLSIIDKFIQEDDVFNSINQMIINEELEINNQKIMDKITEENFKNSFYIELVNFEFLKSGITIDLYIGTEPNYFPHFELNKKVNEHLSDLFLQ